MHETLHAAVALTLAFGCGCDSKEAASDATPPEASPAKPAPADPTPLYRKANVTLVRIPGVAKDGLASISPSGAARLFRKAQPEPTSEGLVDVTWCLHRDQGAPVCLRTGTQQLRCLGGSNAVGWRPDESAVALCGEREERSATGSSFEGWDSVLDFEARVVVQLDPHDGPMVTPIWSRDGQRLLAFPPNGKPHRPWHDRSRKPLSVAPFDDPPTSRPAGEDDFGPVWATAGHLVPGVMLFEPPAMARHPVEVTKAGQDILDATPDGRFAIAEDGKVALGHEGVPWHLLALETKKASALGVPAGLRDGTHAELSDGGRRVLALWSGDDGKTSLGITGDVGATWHVLHRWESRDPDAPHRSSGESTMQWDGGPTAWIIAQSDAVIRVDLTD